MKGCPVIFYLALLVSGSNLRAPRSLPGAAPIVIVRENRRENYARFPYFILEHSSQVLCKKPCYCSIGQSGTILVAA